MTNKLTPEQLATARANFQTFQQRDPKAAASLHGLIEDGPQLGNDSRLIRHFASTSEAPTMRSLVALTFYKDTTNPNRED